VHGDTSALSPGGVRLGAPALTSRSFKERDFEQIAELLHQAVQIALKAQSLSGSKLVKDFVVTLTTNEEVQSEVKALRAKVEQFSRSFPMPGFDPSQIKLQY
jgi:glycine hydroxymethyltransferase